jgi:SPW repeat
MTMRRWVDWVNIILGVWLVASPWLLTEVAGNGPADWSSWSAGIVVMTLALLAMHKPAFWGDAMGVLLGTWLIASPWVLGFTSGSSAVPNAVILGSFVIGYALWATRLDITAGADAELEARRIRLYDESHGVRVRR